MTNEKSKYDLEERTGKFGEEVIKFWQEAKELNLIFNKIFINS